MISQQLHKVQTCLTNIVPVQNSVCVASRPIRFKSTIPHCDFYKEIGRKGGLAGAGSPLRKAAAKKAALTRWQKQRPHTSESPVILEVYYSRVWISREISGLEKLLTATYRYREKDGHRVIPIKASFLFRDPYQKLHMLPTALNRVEKFLKSKSIPYQVKWMERVPKLKGRYAPELTARETRIVNRMLMKPYGGVLKLRHKDQNVEALKLPPKPKRVRLKRAQWKKAIMQWEGICENLLEPNATQKNDCPIQAQKFRLIISLVKSFQRKTLIVSNGLQFARQLRVELYRAGVNNVGLVGGHICDDGDILIITTAAFVADDLPIGERDLIIFSDVPVKGAKNIMEVHKRYPYAIKCGLIGNSVRTPSFQLLIEQIFGSIEEIDY